MKFIVRRDQRYIFIYPWWRGHRSWLKGWEWRSWWQSLNIKQVWVKKSRKCSHFSQTQCILAKDLLPYWILEFFCAPDTEHAELQLLWAWDPLLKANKKSNSINTAWWIKQFLQLYNCDKDVTWLPSMRCTLLAWNYEDHMIISFLTF